MENEGTTIRTAGQATTLVAIPVFNEYRYPNDILPPVLQYIDNVLVLDDGNNDETAELLKKCDSICLLTHKSIEGYGQTLIDDFSIARTNGFEWIITIDYDYQSHPSLIPRFYMEIEKNVADSISGSRYFQPENSGSIKPLAEQVARNKQITSLLNKTPGVKLADSFCGFKAYRVKSLGRPNLTEKRYGLPLQSWIRAVQANLKIREITIPLIYHYAGRNFAGMLEVSKFRLQYYMKIIQQELALYDCKNAVKSAVPEEKDTIFIRPEFSRWPKLLEDNKYILQSFKLNSCREQLLKKAVDYTRKITGINHSFENNKITIVTGHQAIWHHCGILAKSVIANAFAKQLGGFCVHLVLDHDIHDTEMLMPDKRGYSGVSLKKVRIEKVKRDVPVEFRGAAGFKQLQDFMDAVSTRENCFCQSSWKEYLRSDFKKLRFSSIADTITGLQANLYSKLGIDMLYLPVSLMSEGNLFWDFTGTIIKNAAAFADIYNKAISQQIRSMKVQPSHTIRPLKMDTKNKVTELPFWLVSSKGKRFSLLVSSKCRDKTSFGTNSQVLGQLKLKDLNKLPATLRRAVRKRGFLLRPKAVSLTLFARLCLADFFIHGIGGAGYEAITDYIIERYFSLENLHFGIVTATVTLPDYDNSDSTSIDLNNLKQQLRQVRFSPEKFIEDTILKTPSIKTLTERKNKLIKISRNPTLSNQVRKSAWQQIAQINSQLFKHAAPSFRQIERQINLLQLENIPAEISDYREFFFGLFPEYKLRNFVNLKQVKQ